MGIKKEEGMCLKTKVFQLYDAIVHLKGSAKPGNIMHLSNSCAHEAVSGFSPSILRDLR